MHVAPAVLLNDRQTVRVGVQIGHQEGNDKPWSLLFIVLTSLRQSGDVYPGNGSRFLHHGARALGAKDSPGCEGRRVVRSEVHAITKHTSTFVSI